MVRPKVFPEEVYEAARQNGIPYGVVWARIKKSGWSVERATTTPVMTRKQVAEAKAKAWNRFTPEETAYILAQGLTVRRVRERIDYQGWSKEEAMNTPLMTASQSGTIGRAVQLGEIPSRHGQDEEDPVDVIELESEEYKRTRASILQMLDKAKGVEEQERLGAYLLRIRRKKYG